MNEEDERTCLWRQFGPWVLAGVVASCCVILLGLLFSRPANPTGTRAIAFLALPRFQETTRELAESAALVYWGLGLFWSRSAFLGAGATRPHIARVLGTLGTGVLGYAIPVLAMVWTLVAIKGAIPHGVWGAIEGNHGPWRRIPDLRWLLYETLLLPAYSIFLGRVSLLVHSSREGWYVIVTSVLVFSTLIGTHYWLIE